jgi:DNA ligase D
VQAAQAVHDLGVGAGAAQDGEQERRRVQHDASDASHDTSRAPPEPQDAEASVEPAVLAVQRRDGSVSTRRLVDSPHTGTVAAVAAYRGGVPTESVVLTVAGHEVAITSPNKVFFADRKDTKMDLVNYYLAVEEPLMRTMRDRPVLMQRFPNGAGGSNFFQKRVPEQRPDWLTTTIVSTPNGTTARALVVADLAHLLWAVNLGCLGFHSWPVRTSDLDHPDELRIDLDPQPGTTFAMTQEAAHHVRALLDDVGLAGFVKTTGNRGLHVYLRLQKRWDPIEVRAAAVAVARELERRHPDLITAAWWKEERGERIFIDFNQNAPHKTVFAPWSVRARSMAPVSCPLRWEEVDAIHPDDLTIAVVPERLRQLGDPWAAMEDHPNSLEPLLELAERDKAAGLLDAPWPPVYPKMEGEPRRVAPSRARKEPS